MSAVPVAPSPTRAAHLPTALACIAVGGAVVAVLAAVAVPWHPVPGGPLTPVPADSVFTAEQIARAEAYAGRVRGIGWGALAVSLLVAVWLAWVSLTAPRARALMERVPGAWWLRVILIAGGCLLIGRLTTLPFSVQARQEALAVGLTEQSWAGWARDVAVGWGLNWVVSSIVLLILVGTARRWRRAWPAVAGALLAAGVTVGSFGYPLVVEPLFNSFTSLPDGPLRTQVLELAQEEGVAVDDVLVADASRRTTTLNAYVSGFGGSRRVVLYDTLVDDLPRDQALSVVAHELAHAKHDDVLLGTTMGAAGAVAGVGLLGLALALLRTRSRRRSGDDDDWPELGHPATVPLLLALVAVGSLAAQPVTNTVSRAIETRADVDALHATGDPEAFAAMQKQLALRALSDPTPPAWSQFAFGSHPTVLQRVALARRVAGD